MKNSTNVKGYKIDFTSGTIIVNYKFAEASEKYGSPEYRLLQTIKKDFPDFQVSVKSGREQKTTRYNKRLTYKNMEKYIGCFENSDVLLKRYETVKKMSNDAINNDWQIEFQYMKYTIQDRATQISKRNGEMYRYSPYALLINEGNYYMIASDIRGKKLYHFRVDRMKGVKIVYEERTGKDLFRNFDIENYTHRAFSMFGGVEMDIKLQFDNKLLDTVIERFGTGSDVYYGYVDDKHFIISTKVEVSSQFYSWLCGFGTMVKILSPQTAVEGYTEYLKEITNSYKVDDNC